MSNRAWVTLATNDSYGLGALVLAHSLRRAGSTYPAVVLITPSVTDAMRDRLSAVFAEVVMVDVLDSGDAAHLALLQRPELGITFTKIHCWNLTQYEKCVFLDADTLVVQNCDELFEREELSAAPDVGWPDCFNSGVFVYRPSAQTFAALIEFAQQRGSFDGGDQGLLNSYFSDWAHGDINKHLPFLYNVTSAAFYSYLPALKHYGQNLRIIHFIGAAKPWLQQFDWRSRQVEAPEHLRHFLQLWWDLFVAQVHPQLDTAMVDVQDATKLELPQEESVHTESGIEYDQYETDYNLYEPDLNPDSEFHWHRPDAQLAHAETNVAEIDLAQFHDPWDGYKGHIPPIPEERGTAEGQEEIRRLAWESPQHFQHIESHSSYDSHIQHINHSNSHGNHNNASDNHEYDYNQHNNEQSQYNSTQIHHKEHDSDNYYNNHDTNGTNIKKFAPYIHKEAEVFANSLRNQAEYVYCVHLDHDRGRYRQKRILDALLECDGTVNGIETEWDMDCSDDFIIPRHPYDGFYLRHKMTIDARGRKVCTHEIPPTPSPSISPPESPIFFDAVCELIQPEEASSEHENYNGHTGVAGNLARVTPDSLGAQSAAIDELSRRQGWEAGNMDYMGADSFDNIWAKISQTLSQPPSPPKQPTPPPTEAAPVEVEQSVAAAESVPSETPAPAAEEPAKEEPPVVSTPAVETSPETPSETALPEPVLSEEASLPVETADIPVESSVPVEIPVPVVEAVLAETAAPVAADAPIETQEIPAPVLEASALDGAKAVEPKEEPLKEDTVAAPAATEAPPSAKVAESPKAEATAADSPPLANTPSTEAIPSEPAAKSEERRRPAGKLQLSPPSAADPLPTPDSELEDAASLAQSIIASELRTPTVTSPSPPVLASPPQPHQDKRLSAEGPQLPTPPIGAVSLTQIGVKPAKGKATIAAQIESSVADKPEQTPAEAMKKVVKKVAKGPSSEAPVPPPRKKEKKPKEK